MNRINHIIVLLVAGVTLLCSCAIKSGEDTDCLDLVRVYFTPDSLTKVDPAEITKIDLFVFDATTNVFLKSQSVDNVVLTPDFYVELELELGRYKFIAWGNFNNNFSYTPTNFVSGVTTYDQVRISLKSDNGVAMESIPELCFGVIPVAEVINKGVQYFTMPLTPNIYTITVTTRGLVPSAEAYSLAIVDSNATLGFDNTIYSRLSEQITYSASCTIDQQGQAHGTVRVMKLEQLRDTPQFIFRVGSAELFSYKLIKMIEELQKKDPTITLENTRKFDIVLKFNSNMDVSVEVNGWGISIEQSEIIG